MPIWIEHCTFVIMFPIRIYLDKSDFPTKGPKLVIYWKPRELPDEWFNQ